MTADSHPIRRALLSVSDKTGILKLARALSGHGVELLSTGGTAAALNEAGLAVVDVSEHTGFPEMMDGRLKTLHPKVHGGLLAVRGNGEHEAAARAHGIAPIDLLVVNLYPFEATVARGAPYADCVENIDIGGPAMIRAAAKNHAAVTVVVDPADYGRLLDAMGATAGGTTPALRRELAPSVTPEAEAAIAAKKNVRLLVTGALAGSSARRLDWKKVTGGLLVQEADLALWADLKVVSKRQPSAAELADLTFAWTVAKYVKSNAIVYARDGATIGVGAGQMSRVNSSRIAVIKAELAGLDVKGSVVASDAFFPFADGLISAAEAGATAVIQPGGSMRDAEVIAAADAQNLAMVFTGMRHFRH